MGIKSVSSVMEVPGGIRNGPFVSGFIHYMCDYLRRLSFVQDVCMCDSNENPWM